jgi:energy-coupling factor transporter ATP-binding protein EcfA2
MVAAALAGLAATGASILVAEQKPDQLAAICGRVVVLDAGRVVLDGLATDVLANPRLADLGVAPPAAVRLRRAGDGMGLSATAVARLHGSLAP